MSTYLEPLASIRKNISTTKKGHVCLNYIFEGINVSLDVDKSINDAQRAHEALYKVLGQFGLDFSIYGFRARTHPDDLLRRMVFPGLTQNTYPIYRQDLGAFSDRLTSGEQKEFQRVYFVSFHVPQDIGSVTRVMMNLSDNDASETVDYTSVERLEEDLFQALPKALNPRRAHSDHFMWAYNRMRNRGIEVPFAPTDSETPEINYSVKAFPSVVIEKNADGHALIDGAAELYSSGARTARMKETFRRAFRTTRLATALAVNNVPSRRGDAPNGTVSYQTFVQVLATGMGEMSPRATFTDAVDWVTSVDADFVQHVTFDFAALNKDTFRKLRGKLDAENRSLSKDDLDVREFQDKASLLHMWGELLHSEASPIPMRVATLFCFAHHNLEALERGTREIIEFLEDQEFVCERIVGSQFDGLRDFMPGIKPSWITESIALSTTARRYAASMTMRTSRVGDPFGVPVAINRSNMLGQIIFLDLLTSTDAGNGSMAFAGAQGSGKSHAMKLLIGYLSDMEKTTYIVDPSPQGEYEVFVRSLGKDVTVVNIADGQYSLDPLKLYPYRKAQIQFLDVMLPLLDISRASNGAAKLANMLTESYRKTHDIRSTRDLLKWVQKAAAEDRDMEPIYNALRLYSVQPYAKVLIDPVDSSGRVLDLPIVDPSTQCVVFRTYGLDSKQTDEKSTMTQMFTQAVMTQIADYSAWRFDQIADVCAFICDEFAEFKENRVVTDKMIARTDRMGRKERNFVIAGSQLPRHLDDNFDLVKKRFILKQEVRDNAVESFEWVGVEPSDQLLDTMLNETSPTDVSTNKTEAGREGEGWFADGKGNLCPIKIMDHLIRERSRMADTTSTRMIRA